MIEEMNEEFNTLSCFMPPAAHFLKKVGQKLLFKVIQTIPFFSINDCM